MNVTSGGPHILLFERDQQLTALLSSELGLAGYEIHVSRTAVEVFDAIARFPIRLIMVDLAQAQAGRREFWIALDAQRRGRGVQVFTFRCSNLGGYGPDDPDERVQTVNTDLEVDGMSGMTKLIDAVRMRVPGSPVRPAPTAPVAEPAPLPQITRPVEVPMPYQAPSAASVIANAPTMPGTSSLLNNQRQPLQAEMAPPPAPAPAPPARPPEQLRSGPSSFTDKIRAVIYPSSRNFTSAPEAPWSPHTANPPAQNPAPYQSPDVQPRPQASQRFAEADHSAITNREEMIYQAPINTQVIGQQTYMTYNNVSPKAETHAVDEESGLDQLSRLLRESQPTPQANGNVQNMQPPQNTVNSAGLSLEQQEIQELRAQLRQAARLDEAYGRANPGPQRVSEGSGTVGRLRASPIQDMPFEREVEGRRTPLNGGLNTQFPENFPYPPVAGPQPIQQMQAPPLLQPQQLQQMQQQPMQQSQPQQMQQPQQQMQPQQLQQSQPQLMQSQPQPQMQQPQPQLMQAQPQQMQPQLMQQPQQMQASMQPSASQVQPVPSQSFAGQASIEEIRAFTASSHSQANAPLSTREVAAETPQNMAEPLSQGSPIEELARQSGIREERLSSLPGMIENSTLAEQVRANLRQTLSLHPEVRTSDDTLLDIVKSLPPMTPAPQPPQIPVVSGRATRSLGSVLLEGHLVPQERLQVAQHVQRMLRGVDLNYQLGEILLMFKLLTPDQLLAASLVSYGMISTIQITALGRIRQELHAIGLEYDLESLLVLFRILTPEQLREVRASWSG